MPDPESDEAPATSEVVVTKPPSERRSQVVPLRWLAGFLAAAGLVSLQCATQQSVEREAWLRSAQGERPTASRVVVLVPGATGSMLRDSSGRVRWGRGIDLLRPHDAGYGLARPIGPSVVAQLEPFAVIETIRLVGVVRKPIYGPLLQGLEAIGYRRGDIYSPQPSDTLFPFAWDWRASHAEGAAKLAQALDVVRSARNQAVLSVALVCQSSGAHLCRYFAKYGGAALEEVEAGTARRSDRIEVTTMVLVGSSNGGSLRILRELDRGRTYIPMVGRKCQPETLFTFPSLYEDLPAYRDDLFVDGEGAPLDIDLYDAESWRRYGWSAFADAARRRLARLDASTRFGTEAQRLDYLRSTLDRARRLQFVLHTDVGWSRPPRYHLVQSRSDPLTPERAVLLRGRGERAEGVESRARGAAEAWRLRFAGDAEVDREPGLRALAAADGDGHATVESQQWLSREELAALAGPTVYVAGPHFELILSAEASAALAAALSSE
jgi:hypothetical protein